MKHTPKYTPSAAEAKYVEARLAAKNARKAKLNATLKPITDGCKKISDATRSGMQKIRNFTRPIVRFANGYGRVLRRLAAFIFWFSVIAWLRANNPAVFESIPAIDGLLESTEIFVEWSSKFLTWHFELLKDFIDTIIAEIG